MPNAEDDHPNLTARRRWKRRPRASQPSSSSPPTSAPQGGPGSDTSPEPGPLPLSSSPGRPKLRLVVSAPAETTETHWFCGYCGTSAVGPTPPPISRVCETCATGLLLEAPADTAPGSGEAFLIVDSRLTVQAVSRQAEQVLGVCETEVTNQPITDLLTDADVELDHPDSFAAALTGAALSDDQRHSTYVRPRDDYGIRIRARISYCGPPRAALIVLETPAPDSGPRLRLVQSEPLKTAEQGRA